MKIDKVLKEHGIPASRVDEVMEALERRKEKAEERKVVRRFHERATCNKCSHMLIFHAKEGDRQVCKLYGKLIGEPPETCEGLGAQKQYVVKYYRKIMEEYKD